MLIIDEKSVYEIDEECIKKRKVPLECGLPIQKMKKESKIKKEDDTRVADHTSQKKLPQ